MAHKNREINPQLMFLFAATLLSVFVFFFPFGFSPDYFQYIYYFESIKTHGFDYALGYRFEPGFALLSFSLVKVINDPAVVFAIISFFSSALKLKLISRNTGVAGFILAFILFFFKFFPLQDFNQLRVALSIYFTMLLFLNLSASVYRQILIAAAAISFHYSSLFVLPFVYLSRFDFSILKILLIGLLSFIIFKLSSLYVLDVFGQFFSVVDAYNNNGVDSASSAAFSPVFYPELVTMLLLLFFWKDCNCIVRRVFFIQTIGFALFYGLIDLADFSVRGREFFSTFWIFFLTQYDLSKINIKYIQIFFLLLSSIVGVYIFYVLDYFSTAERWVI
ncbi:MAG: EpsG family protein [Burkholderiales bacterium]